MRGRWEEWASCAPVSSLMMIICIAESKDEAMQEELTRGSTHPTQTNRFKRGEKIQKEKKGKKRRKKKKRRRRRRFLHLDVDTG